jgi:TonB-linked SusC/RagA family outer membrane protein
MRKSLLLLTGLLLLLCNILVAQTLEVTGRVLDNNGNPVIGASVQERNSNRGTTTDENGNFRLQTRQGATLIVTSVGFGRSEVVVGTSPTVSITLTAADASLSEVVVTAMGVRREKKALGYAVTTVDKAQLEQRPEGDIARVLQGKTPGVDIGATSGLSGSGTNIVIRGVSTINGNSTPLFVVDGVPFDASTNAQSDFRYGNQTSSRFLDIDPNNIESVSVLRGLSATTLYGELGRNGVILITTKNGAARRVNQKAEITLTQSLFANTVASLPEWQNTYGGGFHQSTGFAFYSNWGAAFQDPPVMLPHPYSRTGTSALDAQYRSSFPDLQGITIPFAAAPNNVNDFFRTGWVNTSSINVAASPAANTNINANYTFYNDKGFTPGNDLRKHTFGLGGNSRLSNRFSVSGTVNFANTDYNTPPNSASTGSGPQYANYPGIFADMLYTPRSVDLMNWPFETTTGQSVYYRPANDIQNPRWTAKYVKFRQAVQRTFGQMGLRYDLANNINLMYRIGIDNYAEENTLQSPKGGVQVPLGVFRTTNGRSAFWTHTLLGSYQGNLSNDVDLSVTAGADYFIRNYNQTGIFSTNQLVFNVWNHQNFVNSSPRGESGANLNQNSEVHQRGVFAEGTFGFRNFLYATVGGRYSGVSTLEPENNSLFYPSASLSFIPTAAIAGLQSNDWINYSKIRLGYGTSARFPEAPYTTRAALNINSSVFADRGGNLVNSNTIPNLLPNPNLKPELLTEVEVGVEGRLLKNRLNIDFTWYNRKATDQILFRQIDPATGYTSMQINGGDVVNRGIEVAAGVNIIRGRNFNWGIDWNFTRNRNEVTSLPEGIDQLVVAGFTDLGGFAKVGYPLGIMQGYYVQRYGDGPNVEKPGSGQLIVDANGDYLFSTNIGIIGDPNPDFKTSFINNLSFKGISFRMQWDYTQGGDIYSATIRSLLARGLTKDTEIDRMLPLILPGVKADGTPNDVQTDISFAYFNSIGFGPSDRSVFDGTVIRLRELSLSYALPTRLLERSPFGGISLTFSGQNLWYNAPNTPRYMNFDPETSGLGTGSYRGFEFITGPSSRRFGGSLRVTF